MCITYSLENNAFSVLHYVIAALQYSTLHRFEIVSAPGKIALGSIRLPPRSLASSRGCSLAKTTQAYQSKSGNDHWRVADNEKSVKSSLLL